jgi:hypothetical protein
MWLMCVLTVARLTTSLRAILIRVTLRDQSEHLALSLGEWLAQFSARSVLF